MVGRSRHLWDLDPITDAEDVVMENSVGESFEEALDLSIRKADES